MFDQYSTLMRMMMKALLMGFCTVLYYAICAIRLALLDSYESTSENPIISKVVEFQPQDLLFTAVDIHSRSKNTIKASLKGTLLPSSLLEGVITSVPI